MIYRAVSLFAALFLFVGAVNANVTHLKKLPQTISDKPNLFVVSIGISRYKDKAFHDLKWSADDAIRVAERLGKGTKYRVLPYLLIDQSANLKDVRDIFEKIRKKARQRDAVVFYFSGHGTLTASARVPGSLEQVIVLNDSFRDDIRHTGLLHHEVRQLIDSIPAKNKALILATCNSGVGKSVLSPSVMNFVRSTKGIALEQLENRSEGVIILSASAKNEPARESDKLKSDVYTHFLLEALDIFDLDQDGAVSLIEAHNYAKTKTFQFSKRRQRPTMEAKIIGEADFPLSGRRNKSGRPVLEAYSSELDGWTVAVNDGVKGQLPLAFPLKQGKNRVDIYPPGAREPSVAYEVSADEGERINLTDINTYSPFYLFASPTFEVPLEGNQYYTFTRGKNSVGANIGLGYIWHKFTLSMNVGVFQTTSEFVPETSSDIAGDAFLDGFSLAAELGYDIASNHYYLLEARGSVGNTWLRYQLDGDTDEPFVDKSGFQAGLGVSLLLMPKNQYSFFAKWMYYRTQNELRVYTTETGGESSKPFDFERESFSFGIGLSYRLGGKGRRIRVEDEKTPKSLGAIQLSDVRTHH